MRVPAGIVAPVTSIPTLSPTVDVTVTEVEALLVVGEVIVLPENAICDSLRVFRAVTKLAAVAVVLAPTV
jgi:hypothetical protein